MSGYSPVAVHALTKHLLCLPDGQVSFWAVRHKNPYLTQIYATFCVYDDFTEPLLSSVGKLVWDSDLRAGRRRILQCEDTMSAVRRDLLQKSSVTASWLTNEETRPSLALDGGSIFAEVTPKLNRNGTASPDIPNTLQRSSYSITLALYLPISQPWVVWAVRADVGPDWGNTRSVC